MTITINGKKQPFINFIKSEQEFIELIKEVYNKVNFNNESINSSILRMYEKLKNEDGGVRYLRLDRWFPKEFGFRHSNRFTIGYWIERGFSENEFNQSIKEKSDITSKSSTKFRKKQSIDNSKFISGYSNTFRFNTQMFESEVLPKCNLCQSDLSVYKSTRLEIPVWKISGCSNENCDTRSTRSKNILWESFLPADTYNVLKTNLKSVKRSFSLDFWINKGMSEGEAIEKQKEIQSNNSKKVKSRPGKSKKRLKEKGYTDEEIRIACLTMANTDYWINRGYSIEESNSKVREHQSNAAKSVDFEKRILPSNLEYWTKKGFTEEESKEKVRESQTTFSKEICINKFGYEKGIEVFNKRTKKWLNSLLKNGNFTIGYSSISQVLFNEIGGILVDREFSYATNGGEFKIKRGDGGYYVYDFIDIKNHKIIEYNGDMYHGNPLKYSEDDNPHPFRKNITARMMWDRDLDKTNLAKSNGFDVLTIWDSDFRYKGDEKRRSVIQKCIDFLNE